MQERKIDISVNDLKEMKLQRDIDDFSGLINKDENLNGNNIGVYNTDHETIVIAQIANKSGVGLIFSEMENINLIIFKNSLEFEYTVSNTGGSPDEIDENFYKR